MIYEKEYTNIDLVQPKEAFEASITNDFIGKDFIEQLEWSMLLLQSRFKQMRFAEFYHDVTVNHFNKAYLLSGTLNDKLNFYQPLGDFQATPDIFPNINIKFMMITETIQLLKVKVVEPSLRKYLQIKRKHAYEISNAFYKKDTEAFYGMRSGFELNDPFFSMLERREGEKKHILDALPRPISLQPGYIVPSNALQGMEEEDIATVCRQIAMSYQIAMSMYYEWSIYIKEEKNIGLVIPINPGILSEIYKTSMLKFDDKKKMLHFVRDHYRRKIANPNEDYSVYVKRYLRGEHKFNYRGFTTEIIPPKYDLNRVRTRKQFIDPMA